MREGSFNNYKSLIQPTLVTLAVFFCTTVNASAVNDKVYSQSDLKSNYGYLLFAVKTQSYIDNIAIRGKTRLNFELKESSDKAHYFLTQVKAGDYYFSEIETGFGEVELDEELPWDFSVAAGTINYIGELYVTEYAFSGFVYKNVVELENKSSFALEHIQEHYQYLLKPLSMRYNGPGEDTFLEFYLSTESE